MTRTRSGIPATLVACAVLASSSPVAAQQSPGLCWRAQPQPRCKAFVLTNASIDVVLGGRRFADNTAFRATADWGLMFNTSQRAAVGASLLASIEKGFTLAAGPAVRYRRWTGSRSSLDFAIGSILILSNHELGSVFGLIKYSFSDWVGIALRPEFVRSSEPTFFGSARRPNAARITVGLELGWWPGALLTVLGGSLAGAAASIKIGP